MIVRPRQPRAILLDRISNNWLMSTTKQHDAVLDYYGRRLATCSSDKTIKIFEIEGDQHRLTETLKGQVLAIVARISYKTYPNTSSQP